MGNLIFFVILLAGGIIMLLKNYYAFKRCTQVTTGIVVDVEYKVKREYEADKTYHNLNEDDLKKEDISYSICPTYEYTVDGKTYQKRSSSHYSNLLMKKGSEIKIHYNPNNPEEYYTIEVFLNVIAEAILLLVGGIGSLSCLIKMLIL